MRFFTEKLMKALDTEGLTLTSLPATTGMTFGGLIQAGCHGTGAANPPLDELVVSLVLVDSNGNLVRFENFQQLRTFYYF